MKILCRSFSCWHLSGINESVSYTVHIIPKFNSFFTTQHDKNKTTTRQKQNNNTTKTKQKHDKNKTATRQKQNITRQKQNNNTTKIKTKTQQDKNTTKLYTQHNFYKHHNIYIHIKKCYNMKVHFCICLDCI